MQHEQRTVAAEFELRAGRGKMPGLRGHAATFDVKYKVHGLFTEVVRPGAFARAIRDRHDVRALWEHSPHYVLGRSGRTMTLSEDARGLFVDIPELPDTQYAHDLARLVERGDVDQMSFRFVAPEGRGDRWDHAQGLRELVDVDLQDVSVATFPVSEATEVAVRSYRAMMAAHTSRPDTEADARRRRLRLLELE